MIIDAYTHFCPPSYVDELTRSTNGKVRDIAGKLGPLFQRCPHFTDVEKRIEHLNKYEIDLQVATIEPHWDPNLLPLKDDERLRLSRLINDEMSAAMRKTHGRIVTAATLPLSARDGVDVEEMDRAIHELGLKGFVVPTNVHGKPIDQFNSFWERAAKLDAPVFIHPAEAVTSNGRPYEDEYDLMHVFGWPFETTLTLSRLVFSGIMENYPHLKVIGHHLGGMIPFFAGRIAESYRTRLGTITRPAPDTLKKLTKPPLDYFKMFYYDTAVGGNKSAIQCACDVFGAERLIFATDYPWGPDGGVTRIATYPSILRELQMPRDDEDRILWKNISSILALER